MTISALTNRVSSNGNGVTTAFAFPYPFHGQADLVVLETVIATGVQSTKMLTTHYTISGTPDIFGHYPNGGTVNMLVAPFSGVRLTVYRDPALTQGVDLVQNDPLPVDESVESPLDRLTMIAQRFRDVDSRTLRQPEGDELAIDFIPPKTSRASKYFGFDADGDPVPLDAPIGTTAITAFVTTLLDDTSAEAFRQTLLLDKNGADIASASSINLDTSTGDLIDVTGTVTITSITLAEGIEKTVRFTGAVIVTHGASLVVLGGVSILTQAGDMAVFRGYAAGVVRMIAYGPNKALGADGTILGVDRFQPSNLKYVNVAGPDFHGVVRSHPDSDSVNTKIRADLSDVTLNDGHYYNPAQGLIFNNAVTGSIGGMQAAAVNSTWNKLYYTRKRSDGSEGLWGVRAKNYEADQSMTTLVNTAALRDAAARTKLAQGFQVTTTGKLESVDAVIGRLVGTPVGNAWFEIWTDSGGNPSALIAGAISDKYDASRFQASGGSAYTKLPFRNPPTLTSGVQYHLVLNGDYTIAAGNHLGWVGNSANSYANGVLKQFDGTATWTAHATTLDASFKLYITVNDTALALPSGYDQYVQIGWFYINGSGNINKFRAQDRRMWTDALATSWEMIAALGVVPTLYDVAAFIPPVSVQLGYGWRGSAAAYLAFGGLEVTNLNAGNVENVSGQRLTFISTSEAGTGVRYDGQEISVEYQSFMGMASAGTNEIYALMISW